MIDPNLNNMNIEDIADRNEYDIRNLIKFFIRNKKIICLLSVLSFFLGFLYASSIKKVWQGQFRIVIEEEKSSGSSLLSLGSSLPEIAGLDLGQVPIKTEVSILNSPSVLMPIYKFATSDKRDVLNTDQFSKWKKNLTITKERNTNVIAVYFKDENKEKIIPVLEKISNSYQAYSGRRLKRSQELSIKYLKEQLALYKIKSANSLRKAQEFAIDQEIFLSESFENKLSLVPMGQNSRFDRFQPRNIYQSDPTFLKTNINIESIRAAASNDIRKINAQLKKVNEINDPQILQYIGLDMTNPYLNEGGVQEKLEKIESNLAELRSNYREEDPLIKISLKQRKNLIQVLKKRKINYLNASKLEAESRLESSIRPKGVLLKYKELVRNAGRDESTLVRLENQLRGMELVNLL